MYDKDRITKFAKTLAGNERKVYNNMLAQANGLIPEGEPKLPIDFQHMVIPADNIRLQQILSDSGKRKIGLKKYNKNPQTGEIKIWLEGFDESDRKDISNILDGYKRIYKKDRLPNGKHEINSEEAFMTRIINPFLKELDDYYSVNMPAILSNAIKAEYPKSETGKRFHGKSESIGAELDKYFNKHNQTITIQPYAADWVTLNAHQEKGGIMKEHIVGYDTKNQNINSINIGAKTENAQAMHYILQNSDVFDDPLLQPDYFLNEYNTDRRNKLFNDIENLLKKDYMMDIAVEYLRYEYGNRNVMFFTTKQGIYSLSQLLNTELFDFGVDPDGLLLSKEFKQIVSNWFMKNELLGDYRNYNNPTWGWIKHLKGYAKLK